MTKVLIVDDEAQMVELLMLVLDRDGRELLPAYDGSEALELAREEQPRVVLSDVMMPGLDGRELCRRIKADPSLGRPAVILMSAGHALDPDEYGADAFIRKPFDIAMLARTVDRFLGAT